MKKSLRNYRLFFHRMGLLFLFIPLIVLILSIVLPDRGFSEKENRVLSSLPHLNGNQIASGGFMITATTGLRLTRRLKYW